MLAMELLCDVIWSLFVFKHLSYLEKITIEEKGERKK